MASEIIITLLNINLLFLVISFTWSFTRAFQIPTSLKLRIAELEAFASHPGMSLKKIFSRNKDFKDKQSRFILGVYAFVVYIILTVLIILFYINFHMFVISYYEGNFWDIIRLAFTPFL